MSSPPTVPRRQIDLRCFLRKAHPDLAARVLAGLLEHRVVSKPEGLKQPEIEAFGRIVARLGGGPAQTAPATSADSAQLESDLLRRVFKPEVFARVSLDEPMTKVLIDRMNEARRCIDARAYLAAVILCGSVLEGICLSFGSQHIERVSRAYVARFNRTSKPLHEWRLQDWIDVLAGLGDLSPNVEKFGHGLRDFRNYVHPAEQLANHFSPDEHTARIGFQVVVAAAEDLVRASPTS